MECPNCQSTNSMKWSGEYKCCIQCGYEDYTSIAKPTYKSNGLHYKARYAGDVESQGGVTVDVYLKKREKETSTKPMTTPHCPFDQRVMTLMQSGKYVGFGADGKTSKYRCYAGHVLYLHTDTEGNFLWN